MESSFVLFCVSMEITIGQIRSRESRYTQKRPCPWANAIYLWVKGLVLPQLLPVCSKSSIILYLDYSVPELVVAGKKKKVKVVPAQDLKPEQPL